MNRHNFFTVLHLRPWSFIPKLATNVRQCQVTPCNDNLSRTSYIMETVLFHNHSADVSEGDMLVTFDKVT